MNRNDIPNTAFGYVSDDGEHRMLLHHYPDKVKSGKEHGSVDPLLLYACLSLVESIPISEEKREKIRADLQAHADVVLWQDEDGAGLPIAINDKMRHIAFFHAHMDGVSETPPVQTEGRGSAYIAYNKQIREMTWWVEFRGLTASESSAHFHIGRSGKPGPIEIPIDLGNPKHGSQILSEQQEKDLFEGNFFLNIHSSAYPAGEIRGQVYPSVTNRGNHSVQDKSDAQQSVPPAEATPQPQFQENIMIEPDRKGEPGGGSTVSKPPAEIKLNPDRGGGPDVSRPPEEAKPQAMFQENVSVEKDRKTGDGGPLRVVPVGDEDPQAVIVAPEPTASQKPSGGGPEVTKPPAEVDPQAQVFQNDFPLYSKELYTSESGFVDFGRPILNVMVEGDSPIFGDETTRNIMENENSTGAPNTPKVSVSKLRDDADISTIVEANRKDGNKAIVKAIESHLREQKFVGRLVIFASHTGNAVDMTVLKAEGANKTNAGLPDAAFAVIERGGKVRHLAHHTSVVKDSTDSTTLSLPGLRSALSQMTQIKAGSKKDTDARIQRIAKAHLIKHARAALPTSRFAKSEQFKLSDVIAELDEAILQSVGMGNIKTDAKLVDVTEESTVKLFRLKMENDGINDDFWVRVRFDENANARWVEFDFDTILPARDIPDFTKFLKTLPTE